MIVWHIIVIWKPYEAMSLANTLRGCFCLQQTECLACEISHLGLHYALTLPLIALFTISSLKVEYL